VGIKDTILKLDQLIPVLATLTGNPQLGTLAQQLILIANGALESRAAATGKTTDEILQEASAEWDKALQNAQDLRNM
jgi:hypothetical protein